MPRISIITPVLNEEDMITPFLDHLALLQGLFDLLIVDGNSSDATRARIQQYAAPFQHRCTFFLHRQAGAAR